MLEASGPAHLTAIKRHELRDTLVVRMYNPRAESVIEVLQSARPVGAGWQVNLLEERTRQLPVNQEAEPEDGPSISGSQLSIPLAAHEILTLEIDLG